MNSDLKGYSKATYGTRRRAYGRMRYALASGKVNKPILCENCDTKPLGRRLHGHHDDYSNPLSVVWLCSKCHYYEHLLLRLDFPSLH